jgi:hypothetical protein
MSKLQFLKQWKSAGPRQPCCKHCDSKEEFTRRNQKIRHQVKCYLRMGKKYD